MKLKKLISVITALSTALMFMICVSVTSSAAVAFTSINNVFIDGNTLSTFIMSQGPIDGQTVAVNIVADENGTLPSIIKYSDIQPLENLYNNGADVKLKLNITDPNKGTRYSAIITGKDVKINAAALKTAGDINIALLFEPSSSELRLYVKTYSGVSGTIGMPIKYSIMYGDFSSLLAQAGVYPNPEIYYYSIKDDSVPMGAMGSNENAEFTITDTCRTGLYYEESKADNPYISKKEATALIKKVLMEKIGLTEAQINGTDQSFTNLVDFYNEAIRAIYKNIEDNYVNTNDIDSLIDKYLKKNKSDLVDAVINDQKLETKIKDKLNEFLGNDITIGQEQTLTEYIKEAVTTEVTNQIGTYNTPSDLVKKVVANAVEEAINSKISQLKSDILNAITGGKTIEDFVNSLKGDKGDQGIQGPQGEQGIQGPQGEQGVPGQNFEEWLVNRYGSEENFIQYIVSRVSAGVRDGKSAYELAVDNGYNGTLTEWLESLKGEDGKSAYEIAVAYGYTGSEIEWLETLGSNNDNDVLESDEDDGDDEENPNEEDNSDSIFDEEGIINDDEVNGAYEDLDDEDDEGPDPDTEPIIPDDEYEEGEDPDVEIVEEDNNSNNNHYYNPATGAALGILIPGAVVGSLLLIRKGKRKRGRR